jgi:DNA-binding HxlR family transcriptional regulator
MWSHERRTTVMSDRERFNRHLLDLLSQPGVVEIIVALRDRGGSASLIELQENVLRRPAPILRSLAAAGQICRSVDGTWDTAPPGDVHFALTAAGAGLAETLDEIEDWGYRNLGRPHRQHRP